MIAHGIRRHLLATVVSGCVLLGLLGGCDGPPGSGRHQAVVSFTASPSPDGGDPTGGGTTPLSSPSAALRVAFAFRSPLPGMPPVIDSNVYAATHAGMVIR